MDFFKKSCKELCEKLLSEEIANTGQLDDFVKTKCNFYNNNKDIDKENNAVTNKEKAILKPIEDALKIKPPPGTVNNYKYADFIQDCTDIGNAKDEDKILMYNRAEKYYKYWKKLKEAMEDLGRRTNVKFFSIFLGVGTGKYYKETLSRINTKLLSMKVNLNRAENELPKSAKEETKQKMPLSQPSDPGIFIGLPNGQNYCYLNTALQELFDLTNFREKVLKSEIPPATKPLKQDKFKELRATQFFFKYLKGQILEASLKNDRKRYASLLGYDGHQKSSYEAKQNIELKCRDQMRKLKNKSSLIQSEETPATAFKPSRYKISKKLTQLMQKPLEGHQKALTDREKEDIISTSMFISQLYRDTAFKEKVMAINTNELNLKNHYQRLEDVKKLFELKTQGGRAYYSEKGCQILYKIRGAKTTAELKRQVLSDVNDFNRSKRAHVLSMDSNISVFSINKDVKTTLKNYFDEERKDGMPYYLPLKNNRFSVTLNDRPTEAAFNRTNFTVHRNLNLTKLVNDNILKIFVKGKELQKSTYDFNLISATIGTGSHYYLYKRGANKDEWIQINDNKTNTFKWNQKTRMFGGTVCKHIQNLCETLTYELKL